jgi:hypothetical protein
MVTDNLNFLDDVGRELAARCQAPAPSSVAPLSAAEETAVQVAKLWNRAMLSPTFLPPEEAAYFPFHADPGPFDILRVWYSTRYGEILIAQTLCVFSLVIEGGKHDVNAMARELFKQSERIHLEVSGTDGAFSYGAQHAPIEGEPGDWMRHLRWWANGESLGFLTLKKSETPGKGMTGWDAELNRYWFRAFQRAK